MESIILSIVTISYNDIEGIKMTCNSIWNTDISDHIEHIIIDGGSNDGTKEFLKENKERFNKVVIGKDKGIFDAMNIGSRLAEGIYTVFMNSGDIFDEGAINAIINKISNRPDFVYGNNIVLYPSKKISRYRRATYPDKVYRGIWCSHQALIVKTDIVRSHPFNYRDYPNGADTEFAFWLASQAELNFVRIEDVLAIVQAEGNSDIKRIESLIEINKIRRVYFPDRFAMNTLSYIIDLFVARIKLKIKRVLPGNWLIKIYKLKYNG